MAEYIKEFPYRKMILPAPVIIEDGSPTTFIEIDLTDLPNGEYEGTLTYLWTLADVNDSAIFTTNINGDIFVREKEPSARSDKYTTSVMFPVTVSDGTFYASITGEVTPSSQNLTIKHAFIAVKRLG